MVVVRGFIRSCVTLSRYALARQMRQPAKRMNVLWAVTVVEPGSWDCGTIASASLCPSDPSTAEYL
jgi:hypothetical protein